MKISEAIAGLEFILKDIGDLEICGLREAGGHFEAIFFEALGVFALPDDDGTEENVCAFINLDMDDLPDTEEEKKKKKRKNGPKLEVVK